MSRPPVGCDWASGDSGVGRSAVGVRGGSGGTAGSKVSAVAALLGSRAGRLSPEGAAGSGRLPLVLATGDTVTWGAGAATTRGSDSVCGSGGTGGVAIAACSPPATAICHE